MNDRETWRERIRDIRASCTTSWWWFKNKWIIIIIHLIPARRPDLVLINKKKRICKIVDFGVPADHRINLKESEKKDKYLDLARELKKLWNMKVTIVPIVIGALGTITKGLLKGLEDLEVGGRVETIQTTALLRTARIQTSPGDLRRLAVIVSEKPSANIDVKNSKGVKIIIYIPHKKTWTWLRKGNLKRETEFLLIAAQNNAIRTNHIKARIDKTQQNSKCRLWGDTDEMINRIISECNKLAKKEYKARHDWVGKVIHWELCKKFKLDHTNK